MVPIDHIPCDVPREFAHHVAHEVTRVYWQMIAAGQLPSRGWSVDIVHQHTDSEYRFAVVPRAPGD